MTRLLAYVPLMLLALLVSAPQVHASSNLTGLWLTQDRGAVIAIVDCGAGLCGRIVGLFLDQPDDRMPVDYRGVSQCELPLITDARQIRPNLWKGHITDPRNGSVYGVELHPDPHGNLALRGFLGIPLLGHTETWTRYTGRVPEDCRITPADVVGGPSRTLPNRPRQAQ